MDHLLQSLMARWARAPLQRSTSAILDFRFSFAIADTAVHVVQEDAVVVKEALINVTVLMHQSEKGAWQVFFHSLPHMIGRNHSFPA